MKRILTSPLAVIVYLFIAFTMGAFVGARLRHKEFMSWDTKSGREYIAFEVKRMAEERPIIEERLEQLIKVFEEHQYTVKQIRIFKENNSVTIAFEED